MHVAQVFAGVIPPVGYGGIERVVYWLTRALLQQGHQVTLIAHADSKIKTEFPQIQFFPFDRQAEIPGESLSQVDIFHFHNESNPDWTGRYPYLVTQHGNNKKKTVYDRNTVFLSRSHARNHQAKFFLPNGIPLDDYPFSDQKQKKLLYLAKLNWRAKNAKTAINLAFDTDTVICLTGGELKESRKTWGQWVFRYPFKRHLIEQWGVVDGHQKLQLLHNAMCLFYLVNWHEPFALAPHEALACGTPVLATPNGALEEYVKPGENGYLVNSYAQAVEVVHQLKQMPAERVAEMAHSCRSSAYSIEFSVQKHLEMYQKVIKDQFLYSEDEAARIRFINPPATRIKKFL